MEKRQGTGQDQEPQGTTVAPTGGIFLYTQLVSQTEAVNVRKEELDTDTQRKPFTI